MPATVQTAIEATASISVKTRSTFLAWTIGAQLCRVRSGRNQVEVRFANIPPCPIGVEACVGAHHFSRKLNALGRDARLVPARYVRPYWNQVQLSSDSGCLCRKSGRRHIGFQA
jgi:hypothetical protein